MEIKAFLTNQLHSFGEISYFQLKSGKEIDFIINKNVAFEVKKGANEHDLRNLKNLAKNNDIENCFVIGRHPNHIFEGFL